MWARVFTPHLVAGAACGLFGVSFASCHAAAQDAPQQSRTEHVVGTGSRLAEQTAQDVRIYDQPRIQNSGQSTVTDFLATTPEVSLNSVQSTFISTTVRLRGAAPGSTLVLINGQRTESV